MKILRSLLLLVLVGVLLASHINTSNDLNQDLSRHLKLGEITLTSGRVHDTNLFSYTNTNFPFINHHWLSEVIFYISSQIVGLNSLIVLKVLLIITAVLLCVKSSSHVSVALAVALLLSPLLLERSDVRPEMFGYLFFAFSLFVFLKYPKYPKLIYGLPFIMMLWVNMHITFVFGMFLLGLLTLKIYLHTKKFYTVPTIAVPLIVSWLALLLNPHFVYGALYPFFIFGNYGYTIVENQNLFFLSSVISNNFITYFFWLSPLSLTAIVLLIIKRKYFEIVLLTVFFGLALYQIRHFPFFVFTAIPVLALAYSPFISLIQHRLPHRWKYLKISLISLLSIAGIIWSILLVSNAFYRTFDLNRSFGFGFAEDGKAATDFVLSHHLPEPIFNNFDIGGELIYRLYPKYKVFVDNRPEAYPADFLQSQYIQLQYDKNTQDFLFKRYNIKTIIFGHSDITPWAREFMSRILPDKSWKLVYLDPTIMILTQATNLPDIRDTTAYLQKQIDNTSNYIRLFHLANVLVDLKKEELTNRAFTKAALLNPDSCAVNKTKYRNMENSPLFYQADEIKSKYWYCF